MKWGRRGGDGGEVSHGGSQECSEMSFHLLNAYSPELSHHFAEKTKSTLAGGGGLIGSARRKGRSLIIPISRAFVSRFSLRSANDCPRFLWRRFTGLDPGIPARSCGSRRPPGQRWLKRPHSENCEVKKRGGQAHVFGRSLLPERKRIGRKMSQTPGVAVVDSPVYSGGVYNVRYTAPQVAPPRRELPCAESTPSSPRSSCPSDWSLLPPALPPTPPGRMSSLSSPTIWDTVTWDASGIRRLPRRTWIDWPRRGNDGRISTWPLRSARPAGRG